MNKYLILIIVILLGGCASHAPYRTKTSEVCTVTSNNKNCANSAVIKEKTNNQDYLLTFFEYDDQGFLQYPSERNSRIQRINELANKGPVVLLTFVHGWHHNAQGSPQDSDIKNFRDLLRLAANTYKNKQVLGVYIGWKGAVFDGAVGDYLDYVTFWDRKNTAHEVGTQGLTSLLLELEESIKSTPNQAQHQMLTIGHSFGGAALFSAIKPVLAERLTRTRTHENLNGVDGYGDMVVLLNPAFEGVKYASLFELAQANCSPYSMFQIPRLVTLSSSDDFPVSTIFPIGRFFTTLFERHNPAEFTQCLAPEEKRVTQLNTWVTDMIAVGHNSKLLTHELTYEESNVGKSNKIVFKDISVENQSMWIGDETPNNEAITYIGADRELVLKSLGISLNNNPYMNIWTDESVIPSHNEIWEYPLKQFIYELLKKIEEQKSNAILNN